MNTKHLMLMAVAVSAFAMSSCKEDPYLISSDEEYTRNFIKTFGLIDPNQDWNLAQSAEITVNVGNHANSLKVYCKVDGKYYIVAKYKDVSGEVTIPFSAPKGANDLLVKIDNKKFYTKAGECIDVNKTMSRGIAADAGVTYGDYTITISEAGYTVFNAQQIMPITTKNVWDKYYSLNLNEMQTNPKEVNGGKGLIPEIGNGGQAIGNRNNEGIIQDFTINAGSNHKFTFYPMYWYTNQTNTMGIYLLDSEGNPIRYAEGETNAGEIVKFPLITIKGNGDLQYWDKNSEITTLTCHLKELPQALSKYINANGGPTFLNNDDLKAEFLKDLQDYFNQGGIINFTVIDNQSNSVPYSVSKDNYTIVSVDNHWSNEYQFWISVTFDLNPETGAPTDKPEALVMDYGEWKDCSMTSDQVYDPEVPKLIRARGYTVDLGDYEGDFGMYLQRTDGPVFYSQTALNTSYFIDGESYACTYHHPISGRTFFSFEDWPNIAENNMGDNDLNDLVFLLTDFSTVGNESSTLTEDEDDTPIAWWWAVEDLGSTDDFDFNDVVVKITSVTTNETTGAIDAGNTVTGDDFYSEVTFTAMAAGGTMPIYLHYGSAEGHLLKPDGDTGYGEFHSWFGDGNIPPTTMINTTGSNVTGKSCTVIIKNFTLANFGSTGTASDAVNSGLYVTVNSHASAAEIDRERAKDTSSSPEEWVVSHPDAGDAPQMFIIYDNISWAWPSERQHITAKYPNFKTWVSTPSTIWWK